MFRNNDLLPHDNQDQDNEMVELQDLDNQDEMVEPQEDENLELPLVWRRQLSLLYTDPRTGELTADNPASYNGEERKDFEDALYRDLSWSGYASGSRRENVFLERAYAKGATAGMLHQAQEKKGESTTLSEDLGEHVGSFLTRNEGRNVAQTCKAAYYWARAAKKQFDQETYTIGATAGMFEQGHENKELGQRRAPLTRELGKHIGMFLNRMDGRNVAETCKRAHSGIEVEQERLNRTKKL